MSTSASFQQAMHVLKLGVDKGLTYEQWQARFDSGILADVLDPGVDPEKLADAAVRDLIRDTLGLPRLRPRPEVSVPYAVTVDYTQSVEEMVRRGKYDYANENIAAAHFPVSGDGIAEREGVLVHFGLYVESDEAVRAVKELELEPSPVEDLLAFGARYPDVQREYPVVGLGSSWLDPFGLARVPVLDGWLGRRQLDLGARRNRWVAYCRFLARRKTKKSLDPGML